MIVLLFFIYNNQQGMRPQSAPRVIVSLSQRSIVFKKQKQINTSYLKYVHCSSRRQASNIFNQSVDSSKLVLKPKIPRIVQFKLNESSVISKKDTFQNILKHNSYKSTRQRTMSFKQMKQNSNNSAVLQQTQASKFSDSFGSLRSKMRNSYISTAVKRQLEQKFQRTKLIFKEQQKMKKIEKIQRIYEAKFKYKKNKASIGSIGSQGTATYKLENQEQKLKQSFQPWQKEHFNNQDTSCYEETVKS